MGFARYVFQRLLLVIPTLFGVTLIAFTLTYLLPGNPALVKAGALATPEAVAEIERRMGLDRPVPVQYWRYVTGLLHGDLGESSSTGRPVLQDFRQRVPATLELTLASLLIAVAVGIRSACCPPSTATRRSTMQAGFSAWAEWPCRASGRACSSSTSSSTCSGWRRRRSAGSPPTSRRPLESPAST